MISHMSFAYPIRNNKSLEAELLLQDTVQRLRITAGIAVVDTVVAAHDRCSTSSNSLGKRPKVHLVQGLVIDVR